MTVRSSGIVSIYIREYIAVNHLQPGDKLPAERTFATELGITRGTLRHGLAIFNDAVTDQQFEPVAERTPGNAKFCGKGSFRRKLYSLYDMFAINGISIQNIEHIFSSTRIHGAYAKLLNREEDTPIINIKITSYTKTHQIAEYTEVLYIIYNVLNAVRDHADRSYPVS